MARANNSPTNWSERLTTADKSNMLTVFDSFRRLPPVRKNDIAEINERLDNYFKICADNAIIPTVEAMELVLGVSRQAMWKWQQEDCEAGQIVGRAKAIINTMIATATMAGKCNAIYSIWLQKNHYGYSDVQTLQLENITEKKTLTAEELPRLFAEAKEISKKENVDRSEAVVRLLADQYNNNRK